MDLGLKLQESREIAETISGSQKLSNSNVTILHANDTTKILPITIPNTNLDLKFNDTYLNKDHF